jgi:hypothetical protein
VNCNPWSDALQSYLEGALKIWFLRIPPSQAMQQALEVVGRELPRKMTPQLLFKQPSSRYLVWIRFLYIVG